MGAKDGSRKSHEVPAADRWDYMTTVVDFMPRRQADEAFEAWLDDAGFSREAIPPKHLVIEDGVSARGPVRRYLVHHDDLPK